MNAFSRLGTHLAIASLLAACLAPGQGSGTTLGRGASAGQFKDIPVPAGMRLHADDSHSTEAGEFRYGDFHYTGRVSQQEIAGYMTRRMAGHGWTLAAPADFDADRVELEFERRPYRTTCSVWHDGYRTHLEIKIRTEVPK